MLFPTTLAPNFLNESNLYDSEDSTVVDIVDIELTHSDIYPPKTIPWLVTYFVISGLGIPGNLLTILVIMNSKNMRSKPINLIIAHQSLIDFFVCFFTIIEETVANIDVNPAIPIFCHYILSKGTDSVCFVASTYNVTLLSVERYLAIVDPLNYDPEKVKKRLPFIFAGIWAFCLATFSIVPSTTIIKDGKCLMMYHLFRSFFWDFNFYYEFTICFAIPITVLLFCYIRMFYCLNQSSKNRNANSESKSSNVDKLRKAQMNIFKTCLTVVGIFVVCWSVLEIAVLLYMIGYSKSLQNIEYIISNLMVLFNSIVNPYVYLLRYDDFKAELRLLFKYPAKV